MKNLLLAGILFLPFAMSGQIVIDQSDMPGAGDTIRLSHTVNTGMIDPELTGPGFTWDFHLLTPVYQSVDTFVAVNQTPFAYQLFFFLTANLAQRQASFDQFPGFQISEPYSFYKKSSSAFEEVGFGVTLNGIPLPTLYNSPDVIYNFPVEEGSIDSSFSSFTFNIPGIAYLGGWKKRKNEVDGWGTLITPFGTFETLRVKSEVRQQDSIYIDSLGFGFPVYLEYTEYKWLGKGMGIPLCEVVDNGLIQTVNYIDSVRSILTGAVHSSRADAFRVFPNPSDGRITVSLADAGTSGELAVYDLFGRRVASMTLTSSFTGHRVDLAPFDLHPGVYLVVFSGEKGIFSKKLMLF